MLAPLRPDMFDGCDHDVPIRVGDKWTAKIVTCLRDGPRRFGELIVPMRPVTAKVLTESLRRLERDGMVERTAFAQSPPHVEYALTALGHSLFAPLQARCDWNRQHGDIYRAARATS